MQCPSETDDRMSFRNKQLCLVRMRPHSVAKCMCNQTLDAPALLLDYQEALIQNIKLFSLGIAYASRVARQKNAQALPGRGSPGCRIDLDTSCRPRYVDPGLW